MITAQQTSSGKPIAIVAGGAGFIGSFLCETLLLQNCHVICIDNFSSGKKENLTGCSKYPDFTLVDYDLRKPMPVKVGETASYIFDLAGSVDVTKNLLNLSEKYSAKLLIVTCQKNCLQEAAVNNFPQACATIVRLADVYGPRMSLENENPTVQLIKAIIGDKNLNVSDEGQEEIYPIFISDAVYALTKIMFGERGEEKPSYFICPKAMTTISFVKEIQKVSQKNLKVSFIPQNKENAVNSRESSSDESTINWRPRIDIGKGIEQTLAYYFTKCPAERLSSQPTGVFSIKESSGNLPKQNGVKKKKSFAVIVFLILIFLPILLVSDIYFGATYLKKSKDLMIVGDFGGAKKSSELAQKYFQRLKTYFFMFPKVGEIVSMGEQGARGIFSVSQAGEKATLLVKTVLQTQNAPPEKIINNPKTLIEEMRTNLDTAFYNFSLIEAELKDKDFYNKLPNKFNLKDYAKEVSIKLPEVRKLILAAGQSTEFFPELIGMDKKKTYLVLLQNNNELRPTGGFIGSYALVTLDKGNLIDFDVKDVYWADGQLKGHVEPPGELKKYLGEANWYLRDSNWSPDFPTSAARARWFLEKETGRVVDGVFGVNLFFAQRLLESVGEIEVPDFKEKINSKNLFERAEYYSEVGFFPGSSQKQDFLGSLSRALFEEIKMAKGKTLVGLGKAIFDSLNGKDLLIFLSNPMAMGSVANMDWDGRVKTTSCLDVAGCFADYLMLAEANVGVNKANYFISRDLSHKVEIKDNGTVNETLKIAYRNESPSESLPGDKYKNYLRLLIPKGAELENIKIEGEEQDLSTINREEIGSKSSFGFLVEVPIQSKKEVEVSYVLADKMPLEGNSQYLFLLQKQPGTGKNTFNLEFTPPQVSTVFSLKPEAMAAGDSYFFSPEFNEDIIFEVTLVK